MPKKKKTYQQLSKENQTNSKISIVYYSKTKLNVLKITPPLVISNINIR